LGGWSANYNVSRWEKDRTRNLDWAYLYSLGPDAWPALRQAGGPILSADDDRDGGMRNDAYVNQAKFDREHWREFSLRAWMNRWALEEKLHN